MGDIAANERFLLCMEDLIDVINNKIHLKSSSSLNFRRRRRRFSMARYRKTFLFLLEMAAVIVLAFLLVSAFGRMVQNLGESMSPTIKNDDKVLIDSLIYRMKAPKRNDIVVFTPSGNLNARYSIKRIIGLPGDKIQVKNGALYVNDEMYSDVINTENMDDPGLAQYEIHLSENEYFVLGDNRNNSEDSRYETIGNVKPESIVGKVWFNVTPGNFGLME